MVCYSCGASCERPTSGCEQRSPLAIRTPCSEEQAMRATTDADIDRAVAAVERALAT